MQFFPLPTRIFHESENLFDFIVEHLPQKLEENSIVVISSKVVALSQGRVGKSEDKKDLILAESEKIFSETNGFFLTQKYGVVIANAGIDSSNVQNGGCILWPKNPQETVDALRENLQKKYEVKNVGVIFSDSRVTPRRKGTVGVAMAWSGIFGVWDLKGKEDLFGRKLEVSSVNVADNVAATADLLMGQADECTPIVYVCDLDEKFFTQNPQHFSSAVIAEEDDLFRF